MTNLSGANLYSGAAVGRQGESMDSPSSFPAYPAYKDSGVAWLGELPQHWRFGCLKHALIELISGGTPESSNPSYWADGDGVPWVAISDMTKGLVINDTAKAITEAGLRSKGLRVIPAGGLLYSIYASIGKVAVLGLSAVTNQAILGLVVNSAVADQQFVRWWLVSLEGWVKTVSSSNTQDNLNAEKVRNLPSAFPSVTEQTQIARFLDHETARIDALIEEQQRLIELLKEKRQAVISHAVTKGLDPTVQMKDSGVKWLGEVPAHWEITQIKRRCNLITDGAHISPETESGVYCFVSTRDVSDEGIDFDGCLRTSAASYEYLVKTGCQPATGDVLFSKDGTIGRTIVVGENSPDFVVASSLIIIRPNRAELLSIYLDFMCQSWVVSQQVDGFVKGAGLPRLSIQNLTKVVGVFPPLEEQALIAHFLQLQCVAARQLSSEAWRTMELLKERRSALISAAVTGKIDVRAWQPPANVPTPKLVQEAV